MNTDQIKCTLSTVPCSVFFYCKICLANEHLFFKLFYASRLLENPIQLQHTLQSSFSSLNYSSLAACAILITFNSSRHFDFSQDAFSKLRERNFDKRRMKVAKRNCEFTKALFKLTNYFDKAILLTNQ